MKLPVVKSLVFLLATLLAACSQTSTPAEPAALAPQFGSSSHDETHGLARHSSGVYAVGSVGKNIFLRKSGAAGGVLWDKYIYRSDDQGGFSVASDAASNAYVVAMTEDNLAGKIGGLDIFIRKYTPAGDVAWTRQFGSRSDDYAYSAAADSSGNLYVTGESRGGFISKYHTDGSRAWTRHGVSGNDLAVDLSGNVYVVRFSEGLALTKLNPDGGVLWTRVVVDYNKGYGTAVAVSGNRVYLVGNYTWHEQTGEIKVAVTLFDTDGVLLWTRPYGLYGSDFAWDASADTSGNLYFGGYRFGGPHPNKFVGFVAKFSPDFGGIEQWTRYIETPKDAVYNFAVLARSIRRVVIRPNGLPRFFFDAEVYAAGHTFGDVGAGNNGSADAYLRRLDGANGNTVWTQ